jgi:hypothetical protein
MPYIDIPIDAILQSMNEPDTRALCAELIADGYGPVAERFESTVNLEDEVIRLDAITWLRANGYTVEPK